MGERLWRSSQASLGCAGHADGLGLGEVGLEVQQRTSPCVAARAWNSHAALKARLRSSSEQLLPSRWLSLKRTPCCVGVRPCATAVVDTGNQAGRVLRRWQHALAQYRWGVSCACGMTM